MLEPEVLTAEPIRNDQRNKTGVFLIFLIVLFFTLWLTLRRIQCGNYSYFNGVNDYICCNNTYVCTVVDLSTKCCFDYGCCSDGHIGGFLTFKLSD